MGNLVSSSTSKRSKPGQITDADRAVLTLKTQRKKLTDQRARIDAQVSREVEVVRELLRNNKKERALLALKRKKLQEKQLENIDSWLLNVESLLLDIETAKQSTKLMDALKTGNSAIKQMQAAMPLAEVESLMEETAEARAHEQALARMLGESFDPADEDAVLEELQALEEEALATDVAQLPTVPKIPDQTTTDQTITTTTATTATAQQLVVEAQETRDSVVGDMLEALPAVPVHKVHSAGVQGVQVEDAPAQVAELAS